MSDKEKASLIIHKIPKNIIIRMKEIQLEASRKGDHVPTYAEICVPILEKALMHGEPENTEK